MAARKTAGVRRRSFERPVHDEGAERGHDRLGPESAGAANFSPKAVLLPLALVVLLFPRQSLLLLTRTTALLQAFTLGMGLKNQFQRLQLRTRSEAR